MRALIAITLMLALGRLEAPRVWDDAALATLELPLVDAASSPKHVSSEYYYRIPVRPIYKSYPIYAPGKEPAGYFEFLQKQEPEVISSPSGEMVFDAPIGYGSSFKLSQVRDREWYLATGVPVTKDGVMPFSRYVIRKKGTIEVGGGACIMCHARLMPDGTLLKGAQGNFPADRVIGFNLREQTAASSNPRTLLENIRLGQRAFFSVPWLTPDPIARVDEMSLEEIAAAYEAIPPGVSTRVNLSLFQPAQIPDLIGIRDIRHLDHTGMVKQRSIEDLMRYIALVQGANSFDRFGTFALLPALPNPERLERYGDEQLFALAQFLYSLKPPANPNPANAAARDGRRIFSREGCVNCHTPPLYTNNKLIAADVIATDATLATQTRKATGFYKVPSLRGVWYRGRLEHSGSVAGLEEWLDPNRTVKGHAFGLKLNAGDRRALIAFLRTL